MRLSQVVLIIIFSMLTGGVAYGEDHGDEPSSRYLEDAPARPEVEYVDRHSSADARRAEMPPVGSDVADAFLKEMRVTRVKEQLDELESAPPEKKRALTVTVLRGLPEARAFLAKKINTLTGNYLRNGPNFFNSMNERSDSKRTELMRTYLSLYEARKTPDGFKRLVELKEELKATAPQTLDALQEIAHSTELQQRFDRFQR